MSLVSGNIRGQRPPSPPIQLLECPHCSCKILADVMPAHVPVCAALVGPGAQRALRSGSRGGGRGGGPTSSAQRVVGRRSSSATATGTASSGGAPETDGNAPPSGAPRTLSPPRGVGHALVASEPAAKTVGGGDEGAVSEAAPTACPLPPSCEVAPAFRLGTSPRSPRRDTNAPMHYHKRLVEGAWQSPVRSRGVEGEADDGNSGHQQQREEEAPPSVAPSVASPPCAEVPTPKSEDGTAVAVATPQQQEGGDGAVEVPPERAVPPASEGEPPQTNTRTAALAPLVMPRDPVQELSAVRKRREYVRSELDRLLGEKERERDALLLLRKDEEQHDDEEEREDTTRVAHGGMQEGQNGHSNLAEPSEVAQSSPLLLASAASGDEEAMRIKPHCEEESPTARTSIPATPPTPPITVLSTVASPAPCLAGSNQHTSASPASGASGGNGAPQPTMIALSLDEAIYPMPCHGEEGEVSPSRHDEYVYKFPTTTIGSTTGGSDANTLALHRTPQHRNNINPITIRVGGSKVADTPPPTGAPRRGGMGSALRESEDATPLRSTASGTPCVVSSSSSPSPSSAARETTGGAGYSTVLEGFASRKDALDAFFSERRRRATLSSPSPSSNGCASPAKDVKASIPRRGDDGAADGVVAASHGGAEVKEDMRSPRATMPSATTDTTPAPSQPTILVVPGIYSSSKADGAANSGVGSVHKGAVNNRSVSVGSSHSATYPLHHDSYDYGGGDDGEDDEEGEGVGVAGAVRAGSNEDDGSIPRLHSSLDACASILRRTRSDAMMVQQLMRSSSNSVSRQRHRSASTNTVGSMADDDVAPIRQWADVGAAGSGPGGVTVTTEPDGRVVVVIETTHNKSNKREEVASTSAASPLEAASGAGRPAVAADAEYAYALGAVGIRRVDSVHSQERSRPLFPCHAEGSGEEGRHHTATIPPASAATRSHREATDRYVQRSCSAPRGLRTPPPPSSTASSAVGRSRASPSPIAAVAARSGGRRAMSPAFADAYAVLGSIAGRQQPSVGRAASGQGSVTPRGQSTGTRARTPSIGRTPTPPPSSSALAVPGAVVGRGRTPPPSPCLGGGGVGARGSGTTSTSRTAGGWNKSWLMSPPPAPSSTSACTPTAHSRYGCGYGVFPPNRVNVVFGKTVPAGTPMPSFVARRAAGGDGSTAATPRRASSVTVATNRGLGDYGHHRVASERISDPTKAPQRTSSSSSLTALAANRRATSAPQSRGGAPSRLDAAEGRGEKYSTGSSASSDSGAVKPSPSFRARSPFIIDTPPAPPSLAAPMLTREYERRYYSPSGKAAGLAATTSAPQQRGAAAAPPAQQSSNGRQGEWVRRSPLEAHDTTHKTHGSSAPAKAVLLVGQHQSDGLMQEVRVPADTDGNAAPPKPAAAAAAAVGASSAQRGGNGTDGRSGRRAPSATSGSRDGIAAGGRRASSASACSASTASINGRRRLGSVPTSPLLVVVVGSSPSPGAHTYASAPRGAPRAAPPPSATGVVARPSSSGGGRGKGAAVPSYAAPTRSSSARRGSGEGVGGDGSNGNGRRAAGSPLSTANNSRRPPSPLLSAPSSCAAGVRSSSAASTVYLIPTPPPQGDA